MCGISGKLYFNHQSVERAEIESMNQTLIHRGPDDQGIFCHRQIGLGQTRLSIIDLSRDGHQPMSNENETIWITFNGEIYNFLELKPLLEAAGHQFKSKTDTEVIIHAYEEYGIEGCLKRLRGMFAFALWDSNIESLFLARDRVGKKPLKYFVDHQGIIFASELKAILTDRRVARNPDYQAIDWYLTHQYVPAPHTGFKNIYKLPQAHYLTCDMTGQIKIKRYWQLEYKTDYSKSDQDWSRLIIETLDEAVKLRMIADVPVGAFLSGGVDSSAVVASMAIQSNKPVKTFSIGFKHQTHNELPFARQVAERYQTDHTELIIDAKQIDLLPNLIYHYEEPYADSSALPTYCVSRLTKNYVTVALNGDGGDENFAGYPWHRLAMAIKPLEFLQPLINLLAPLAKPLYQTQLRHGAVFLDSYSQPISNRSLGWMAYFAANDKRSLYTQDFSRFIHHPSPVYNINDHLTYTKGGVLDKILYTDINSYLADDLVVKVDIASMAVALETRSPLLDQEMLELAATIPDEKKVYRGQTKYLFKKSLEPRLPHQLLYRKKQGFSIPIDSWFADELAEWSKEILLDKRSTGRGLFDKNIIAQIINNHISGKAKHGNRIWALIALELWFRRFIDQN